MEKDLDIADIKRVLEEANLYEPHMSEKIMVQYYKAINESKTTASEENDTRQLNESQKNLINLLEEDDDDTIPLPTTIKSKSFTLKNWSSEKKNVNADVPERNNNENKEESDSQELTNDCPKDATKEMFGFNEMVKDSNKSLSIIAHKIKFVPIQNSPKFMNADLIQKAKMLYAYHTKLDKMKTRLARMSFYPAPIPKITSSTDTFPSSNDDIDFEETYISRSGRQTKRKIYNYDDEDSLDNTSSIKKTKNSDEGEWLSKTSPNKNQRSKKNESNHVTSKTFMEVEISVANSTNDTSSNETPNKPPPKPETKSNVLKKLTNDEIIKRSRIFSDPPKRRCELMFDKLKDEEEKKQREEKTMEAFNRTLEGLDEEENDFEEINVEINVTDNVSLRKRVVPTIPRRRAVNRKRSQGLNPLNVVVNSPGQKDTPKKQSQDDEDSLPKVNGRKRLVLHKNTTKEDEEEPLPSTSQLPKEAGSTNVTCPICNGSFRGDKIEEHASTCGDEPVTRSASKFSRITCPICDKVIPPDSDFNSHVVECSSGKDEGA